MSSGPAVRLFVAQDVDLEANGSRRQTCHEFKDLSRTGVGALRGPIETRGEKCEI